MARAAVSRKGSSELLTRFKPEKILAKWRQKLCFLIKHKNEALPLVATELKKEVQENKPNNFFLLDAGYFLFLHGDSAGQSLSLQALQKVDHTSKIIQVNYKELFEFSHGFCRLPRYPRVGVD